MRVIINLIRASNMVESSPNASPRVLMNWSGSVRRAENLFDGMGETTAKLPRCAGALCENAWDPKGGPLRACSVCKNLEYCSRTCQKA